MPETPPAPAGTRPLVAFTDRRLAPLFAPIADRIEARLLDGDNAADTFARAEAVACVGTDRIDGAFLDRFAQARLIVSPSSGIDGIDVAAAAARGIAVTSGAGINAPEVAGLAVSLILAHRSRIAWGDAFVRGGEWRQQPPPFRRSLREDRVGIVGLGGIGKGVATTMATLCGEVGWHGPRPQDVAWRRFDTLAELARWSDILVLCARGSEATRGLVDEAVLEAVGPEGLFVNVARGFMVDEEALRRVLGDGRLGGAALDVFAREPTDPAIWAGVPNVLFSPHTAGVTTLSVRELAELVQANLLTLIHGGPLRNVVAPPAA